MKNSNDLNVNGFENLLEAVSHFNGCTFVSIDLKTVPAMNKRNNPHYGRVEKVTKGIQAMMFRNENGSSYEAKVKRDLEKSGKNPEDFKLSPRTWGNRVTGSPFVAHKGALYLEFIAQNSGETVYLLDGVETAKEDIQGLRKSSKPSHGVITRTAKLESVTGLRIGGKRYQF
jgi:hypothetical protein